MSKQHRFRDDTVPASSRSICGRLRRSTAPLAALIAFILLAASACTSDDGAAAEVHVDPAIAELFEATARSGGTTHTYRVGLRALLELGPDIRDYLQAKANSADWQDRWLARALIMELDDPERTELIRRVLAVMYRCDARFLDNGSIEIDYDERYLDRRAESAGKTLIVGPEEIPLFIQALPQYKERLYTDADDDRYAVPLLRALVHFNDPDTAEAMLWRCKGRAVDSLAEMGRPVVGVLETVVARPAGAKRLMPPRAQRRPRPWERSARTRRHRPCWRECGRWRRRTYRPRTRTA